MELLSVGVDLGIYIYYLFEGPMLLEIRFLSFGWCPFRCNRCLFDTHLRNFCLRCVCLLRSRIE